METSELKMCTCQGTCRGANGLGEGWRCALAPAPPAEGVPKRPDCMDSEPREGLYVIEYKGGAEAAGVYVGRDMEALKRASAAVLNTKARITDFTMALVRHSIDEMDREDDMAPTAPAGEEE